MNGKRVLCGLLTVLLLFCCGCGGDEPDSDPTPTTVPWVATAPETLDISSLLTASEVSEALNATVGEGVLYEHDTLLSFTSADYKAQLSLLVEQPETAAADYFAALLDGISPEELVMAPNLGDEAYWCASTGELLVHSGEYVLSVIVTREGFSAENALIAARQLAALAIERLK